MVHGLEKRDRLILTAVVAVGIALRVPGLFNDFWLDEIWSLALVAPLTTPLQVFTSVHFDLNHWLHSLILLAIGDHPYWPVYRLPALAAACASLIVVATWPVARSREERLLATGLFAISFALVVYSTEARGYAWLVLFSLLCYRTLLVQGETRRSTNAGLFWIFAILGFLSQVTFAFVYASLASWAAGAFRASSKAWGQSLRDVVLFFAVPTLFFCWLYVVDIQFVEHGGAGAGTLLGSLVQYSGWLMGTPSRGWAGDVSFALLLALVGLAAYRMRIDRDPGWILYLSLLVVPVAVALITSRDGFSYWKPRHFIGLAPFFILLAARGLASQWNAGPRGQALVVVCTSIFIVGNAVRIGGFFVSGRGHYLEAVQYMADHDPDHIIEVGGDHDFRTRMILRFYSRYLPNHDVRYIRRDRWEASGPLWFLAHAQEAEQQPAQELSDPSSGLRYELEARFPYSGVSGWNWYLYRNAAVGEPGD